MKLKKNIIILILALSFNASIVLAAPTLESLNSNVKIDKLTLIDDSLLVKFKQGLTIPSLVCELSRGLASSAPSPGPIIFDRFVLKDTHTKFDEIYALLLSARLSDELVTIKFANNSKSLCSITAAELSS
jgi:hypothetical protein